MAQPPNVDAQLLPLIEQVIASRRPVSTLLEQLRILDGAGDDSSGRLGILLFENLYYRLPDFSDSELPATAGRLYARADRSDVAFLLAGLSAQLRPQRTRPPVLTSADASVRSTAASILASADAGGALLLALETLEGLRDWQKSALLFEAIWPHVSPISEYWIYHRMSQVYDALDRNDAAVLLAVLAIRAQPRYPVSDTPHRRLLRHFLETERFRDAAELCTRRHSLCAEPRLLDAAGLATLVAESGPLLMLQSPFRRTDTVIFPREVRKPRPWPRYGGALPTDLAKALAEMDRPPVVVSEIRGADVLIDRGSVAVFGADGFPHADLSTGRPPTLVQAMQAENPEAIEELFMQEAMLVTDQYPNPHYSHFLLDHATRIALYRSAGVNINETTAIGLAPELEYQDIVAQRMGVRSFVSAGRRAHVLVYQLYVSSNCQTPLHPAHLAADWAVTAVRSLFDLAPRGPARRLLVSREDVPSRCLGNHEEVAELLVPLGFEVIVPGRLPFEEQVAAFRDATHIVAPHGAALANLLFCAPGTHVLEVFHPHYSTYAYCILSQSLNLNYASMIGRDALSDAAEFNEPSLPREQKMLHANRGMRMDMGELRRWLTDTRSW